tara:strand:- start:211 stop:429 length:219 start_codon:yes stop_codon:yes gene_type:complete
MINPLFFFIGLFIGFFIIYINSPIPEIIIQYPTPKNAGNIVYKDKDDVCYKYKVKQVSCPKDKKNLKKIKNN